VPVFSATAVPRSLGSCRRRDSWGQDADSRLKRPVVAPSMLGMSIPRSKLLAAAAAAVLLLGSPGCGATRSTKKIADNASTLRDLSNKLNNAETLTFQAEYELNNGWKVTVAQQPPNFAAVGPSEHWFATADSYVFCDTGNGDTTCQRAPREADDTDAGSLAAGVSTGFVQAAQARTVLTAATLIPSAKVDKKQEEIAGQKSTCATVSNLESGQQDKPAAQRWHDFTACVTDAGILARYTGIDADGTKQGVELTHYSTTVDSKLFQVPAGAKVTDVGAFPTGSATG
jgi:hypothetical protein